MSSRSFAVCAQRPAYALASFVALLVLAGCGKPEPAPEPVRSVKLVTVGVSAYGTQREYAAEVRAEVETRLGFRVGGKLQQRQAQAGQRVRAGELLAELDPQDLRLAADAVRAQVAAATTQRDLAAAELRRYTQLREQNFISGAELERRQAGFQAAQAQLDQVQAQLAVQGNQATYARLVAPAAGVVTAVEAEPGQVVATGTPVLRLALDGPRDAVFALPEDLLPTVRAGQPAQVRQWADGRLLAGRVREISAVADPATRTYSVKVRIDADPPPPLGATVYVTPQGQAQAAAPVIKVPTTALRQEGPSTAVWVLDPATMTVRLQPVQVRRADHNEAVVESGLQPGMQVVSAGVHVLQPGQKVTVWQDPAAAAAAPAASAPAGGAQR